MNKSFFFLQLGTVGHNIDLRPNETMSVAPTKQLQNLKTSCISCLMVTVMSWFRNVT